MKKFLTLVTHSLLTPIIFFHKLKVVFLVIAFSIPLFVAVRNVLSGSIPFSFDTARDFLLAWNNLLKPTLIGPPSGIPGIFYGPYWIWLISAAMLISFDPRIITLLILTLPFFTYFPFILYQLTRRWQLYLWLPLWTLFSINFQPYTTSLWHPDYAPLLFLLLIFTFLQINPFRSNFKNHAKLFVTGLTSGLILNFHLSFGIGVFLSCLLMLLLESLLLFRIRFKLLKILKYRLAALSAFNLGVAFIYLPWLVFEFRHGFRQIGATIYALSQMFFYNSAVVGQTGLPPYWIARIFFEQPAKILNFSLWGTYIIVITTLVIVGIKISRQQQFLSLFEKRLLLLLVVCASTIMFFFLSSKNPVWNYHLIGTEIIFLLLLGFLSGKLTFFRYLLWLWAIWQLVNFTLAAIKPTTNPYTIPSLTTKQYILDLIYQDTKDRPFAVFPYSPSIYTFDYDYLFKWLGQTKYPSFPETGINSVPVVYLIIPPTSAAIYEDFIHYRTPDLQFTTARTWNIPDGTVVIKRIKKPF